MPSKGEVAMDNLTQGLYVTVFGMGLVFAALTILLLAMLALERIFREGGASEQEATPAEALEASGAGDDRKALAAAIGAAVVSLMAAGRAPGPEASATSPWGAAGRRDQMQSRDLRR